MVIIVILQIARKEIGGPPDFAHWRTPRAVQVESYNRATVRASKSADY
jgi:hypothetical protein